ncbi:MAG: hypothetical protein CL693_13495 [Cellvibrionaceae bacterium]|nr:hypothetical protein [Cellvibrionaceae bacterium]|tara:strand:+ start:19912 stop:20811 length:900 start_codon:yes stop_codon:yes gene_type:complete
MKEFDTSLDARQLKLFLSLMETLSLTRTAEMLGIGQPAVSHALNRLREELRDPLFVRSGRGFKPTPHALEIVERVNRVMRLMDSLPLSLAFDPAKAQGQLVIGANEYQRDLLLPQLHAQLRRQAPQLRIISNPLDPLELLRDESVDLVLTPTPPDKSDVHVLKLNVDEQTIFYDPQCRDEPQTEDDFLQARYLVPEVIYDSATGLIHRNHSPVQGHDVRPELVVNTFSGIPNFLRGSDMLAPLPGKMTMMQGFAQCSVPNTHNCLSLHLCWHQRYEQSPKHQWLIKLLKSIAAALPNDS